MSEVPDETPLQRFARERVGTVVGDRWMLEAVIGIGGMSSVFAARHRNGNRVAIKILHPMLALLPSAVQRFVREGYAANLVEHPGVVTVLDDGEMEGVPFLVMELLEGESADERSDRLNAPLPVGQVLGMARKVLAVLEAAHAKLLVHRDVKPDNIFLTSVGDVKLLDFGVARLSELGGGENATQTGSPIGTPSFMSPEQARGNRDHIDRRTDLYGLGATMFYLLSREIVHPGTTASELMMSTLTRPARSLAEVRPDLPGAIVRLVDGALAYDPDRRWQTATEMQTALTAAAKECGLEVPVLLDGAGWVPPPPPPRASFTSLAGPMSQRHARGDMETLPPPSSNPPPSVRSHPPSAWTTPPRVSSERPLAAPPPSASEPPSIGQSGDPVVASAPPPAPRRMPVVTLAVGALVIGLAAWAGWALRPTAAPTPAAAPLPASSTAPSHAPEAPPSTVPAASSSTVPAVASSAAPKLVPTAAAKAKPTTAAPVDLGDSRQ